MYPPTPWEPPFPAALLHRQGVVVVAGVGTDKARRKGVDRTGYRWLIPVWHSTLSPPTRKRSTAAPLMPCRSHSPDRISLMENPDFTATTQDVPSGRWTQQCLAALSLSSAEVLQVSDCRVGTQMPMSEGKGVPPEEDSACLVSCAP